MLKSAVIEDLVEEEEEKESSPQGKSCAHLSLST